MIYPIKSELNFYRCSIYSLQIRFMAFKHDFAKGVAYTAIAKYFSVFISIFISAILARLLTPEDFAIIAIATVFIGFITLLTGSGLSPAIIQQKNLTKSDIRDLFSFTIYLAIIASILFLGAIPLISKFYSNHILENICLLLIVNVFFSVVNIVPNALLFKEKRFKYIAIRTIVVQTSLGALSVIGALSGLGVYALLINPIIGSILLFIISYRCYNITVSLRFNFTIIKSILPYSAYQIGFNILNYGYRNTDTLLIGRYLGMNTLGFYEKSYRLMMMPLDNLSNVINPVLHPLLSEYQDNRTFIFEKYKQLTRYLGYIGFLLTGFCFSCASDIILILFGEQWVPSISIFKILSLSIGIQIVQSAVGAVFQSTGKVKLLFFSGLLSFIVSVGAIVIGILSKNIDFLASLIVLAFILAFIIYHVALIKIVMEENFLNFISSLCRPILSGLIIGIILSSFKYFCPISNMYINFLLCIAITFTSILIMQKVKIIVGMPDLYNLLITKLRNVKIRRPFIF